MIGPTRNAAAVYKSESRRAGKATEEAVLERGARGASSFWSCVVGRRRIRQERGQVSVVCVCLVWSWKINLPGGGALEKRRQRERERF